jgi:hypothetical protein
MCKLLVSTRWAALGSVAIVALAISAWGDDQPGADPSRSKPAKPVAKAVEASGGAQRIMKVLDEPTDLDFVETPLKDVIQAISIRHNNIPIQLDTKGLHDAGSTADAPVTFQLKGIPLRAALRVMLHEHNLDFAVSSEVLLITSADSPTTLRQYDVSDLLRGTSMESLIQAVTFALPRTTTAQAQPAAGAGGPAAPLGPGGASGGGVGSGGPTATTPDGEVMSFQSVLLVRATDRGHSNVETFLAELRHHMTSHAATEKTSGEK